MKKLGWEITKITDESEKLHDIGDEYEADALDGTQYHFSQNKWYSILNYHEISEKDMWIKLQEEENCIYQLKCDFDTPITLLNHDNSISQVVLGKIISWKHLHLEIFGEYMNIHIGWRGKHIGTMYAKSIPDAMECFEVYLQKYPHIVDGLMKLSES